VRIFIGAIVQLPPFKHGDKLAQGFAVRVVVEDVTMVGEEE
jgi:hypothetical protein